MLNQAGVKRTSENNLRCSKIIYRWSIIPPSIESADTRPYLTSPLAHFIIFVDTAMKELEAKFIVVIAGLLLVSACSPGEQRPIPTPTLPPVALSTPIPTVAAIPTQTATAELPTPTSTATELPAPTSTATELPTPIPTATATVAPTPLPTDTPTPTVPPRPSDTPAAMPAPLPTASQGQVIYHDARVAVTEVGQYPAGTQPWLDLLVQLDGNWYGPERYSDEITAVPLPPGYRWEVEGSFSALPDGQAWWTGPDVHGHARLLAPDGSELYALHLMVGFD